HSLTIHVFALSLHDALTVMIDTYVKVKNSEHSVNLSIESYLSQLEFKDAQSVKNTINKDVENELARREREMERQTQKEAEKKREEEWKFEKQDYAVDDIPVEPSAAEMNDPVDDLPFGDIGPEREEMTITLSLSPSEKLELTGYLQTKGFDWRVV